ncbi:MAG: AAA family ATPase [Kiritimatiellae bacterium]|nr:AAA family ATPase [Kiritimatiellia bacterium]
MNTTPESVNGFVFARAIIEQKGDEAVDILLKCADGAETDWLEKKAAVYRSESKDKEYREALEKCRDPKEIKQVKESLNNELLENIATAIVAIHNSRGGVLFIGIDDKTNEPVPFADNDGGRIWINGKDEYARKAVQDRLFRENKEFKCPNELSWIVPTKEIEVISRWCHYKDAEVLALIIPPLPLGKYPLEIECIKSSTKRRFVPRRSAGDVGRVKKVEIKEVCYVPQLNEYIDQRQKLFLDREDLSAKLKDLGISIPRGKFNATDAVPAREVYSSVIPPQATNFVGRDNELKQLHGLLLDGKIPVVTGAGGTGKSELVFQYAERHKTDYPGGLFQIDMETVQNWEEAFRRLLGTTRVNMRSLLGFTKPEKYGDNGQEPTAIEIAGALARRAEQDGRILLFLDNVESVENFFGESILERETTLPPSVSIVATARQADISFDRGVELQLLALPLDTSIKLLVQNHPADTDAEQRAASKIAELLCGIPLYLCRIRALLAGKPRPFATSYSDLESKLRKKLLDMVGTAMDKTHDDRTPDALWNLTSEALSKDSAGVALIKLAHISSFFSPDGFKVHILRHLWDELIAPNTDAGCTFEEALDVLSWHWILSCNRGKLRMHRLNAEALRRSARELDHSLEEEIGKALASFEGAGPKDWLALIESYGIVKFAPRPLLHALVEFRGRTLQFHILSRHPDFQDSVQWEALLGEDWAELLANQPQYAKYCQWSKLNGTDWSNLLASRPDFAERCEWDKLNTGNWVDLLEKRPEFMNRCPWEKLRGKGWSRLLEKRPEFEDRCPWDKLGWMDWANLIGAQPRFDSKCPWNKLDGYAWVRLLKRRPELENLCPWDAIECESWTILLEEQPEFADRHCCPWDKLDGKDWANLIVVQPRFDSKCPWNKLDGYDWATLLEKRPELKGRCPWDKLEGGAWARLLSKQPQFADRCPWNQLDEEDWSFLLKKQPQFAEHFPWDKLNLEDFDDVLQLQPQLADDCPWTGYEGYCWAMRLTIKPQLADDCPWDLMDGDSWASLLAEQPQFSEHCPWNKLDGEDWVKLLAVQPQFSDRCDWDKLDGTNWRNLLNSQPQFADRCPWDKLDGNAWEFLLSDNYGTSVPRPEFCRHCDWGKLNPLNWLEVLQSQPQLAKYRNSGTES